MISFFTLVSAYTNQPTKTRLWSITIIPESQNKISSSSLFNKKKPFDLRIETFLPRLQKYIAKTRRCFQALFNIRFGWNFLSDHNLSGIFDFCDFFCKCCLLEELWRTGFWKFLQWKRSKILPFDRARVGGGDGGGTARRSPGRYRLIFEKIENRTFTSYFCSFLIQFDNKIACLMYSDVGVQFFFNFWYQKWGFEILEILVQIRPKFQKIMVFSITLFRSSFQRFLVNRG